MNVNKIKILISSSLFFLFLNYSYSQQPHNKTLHKVFVPLKYYKKKYNKTLTKLDSSKFKIVKNDTLISVENFKRPDGVSIPYEFKDSTFLHYYKKIAFKHKNDSIDPKTRMKYWKKPIKIFFSKSVKRKTKKEFLKFTSYISKNVDSLNISEVKKIEDSNYIIYYKDDFEYESRLHNKKNTDYYLYWNKRSQIYKCALRLDAENNYNENLKLYNLKDFFLITLGYFKRSNELPCESVFSNCFSKNKHFSNFDLALLKYHYSYGICKGTSLKIFEEQHERSKKSMNNHHSKVLFYHTN